MLSNVSLSHYNYMFQVQFFFLLQIFVSDSTGEVGSENKRLEDTTVGSADGPVSLDVRRPQKTRKVRRLL